MTQRKFNIYNSIKKAIFCQWEITFSSDGYSNYGVGNQITSDNSGAHGFSNPNAWCVLSKTINNQQYQFCIQTDGYMGFRLKYSKIGFTSGMDNLGSSPTATDQQILLGDGYDTSPTYQQVLNGHINFNKNGVIIHFDTSTNKLNFSLMPPMPKIKMPIEIVKPVINKNLI